MDDELPDDLKFTPSDPGSFACKFSQHTPLWSSSLVVSRSVEYNQAIGKHVVKTVQQIGRCTKCGVIGAELAEQSIVESQEKL